MKDSHELIAVDHKATPPPPLHSPAAPAPLSGSAHDQPPLPRQVSTVAVQCRVV